MTTIGLLVEADADAATVRVLVDRLLERAADWVTPELLRWRGFEPQTEVAFWTDVKHLCRGHGVRLHGKFDGEPGAADAHAARRALALFRKLGAPDAIILVRDADDQARNRLTGLQQARADGRYGIDPDRVAIGVAVPEREAWHLVGFIPCDEDERRRLMEERQRLGFDPNRQPHRLRGNAKRNAKPVLDKLTDGDHERERQCLADLPLDAEHCGGCGLTPFLTELRQEQYNIPAGAEPLLRPYVESGSKFFVAKVDAQKVQFEQGQDGVRRAKLSPLRFHYDTQEFALPIRLGLINASGPQDLLVHILAREGPLRGRQLRQCRDSDQSRCEG